MADAEILTGGVDLPPERRGMIRHALQRIGRSGNGWHGPVEMIEITRLIDAGRSGAVVVEVALRAGAEYRQRVVKIGPAAEMATEYANFRKYLVEYPATVCAPVQEATPGAVDPAAQQDGVVEAVAYAHVAEYAGRPRIPAPTLEDLVRAAFDDPTEVRAARRMIEQLFTKLSTPFHNRRSPVPEARSLRDLNPSLGPDVVLDPGSVRAEPVYADDVIEASFGSGQFTVGQELRVADSGGGEIRVETPDGIACFAGRVVQTRFTEQRRRLDGAFTTIDRSVDSVVADRVRTADPAGGLRPALTDPRFGRVRGVVHGDLNARNAMCVEGQPILIDFAMTTGDRPVLSDAAWLEISLLRDVFAELPYADLVRLQRFLALTTRFRPYVADVAELEAVFDGLLEGQALVAFHLLHEIRTQAQRTFPEADAWLDHLAQLHLSAYRTVKWDTQPPGALRAVHAAAAVATEWLAAEDPFAHWDDLPELLRRLSPITGLTRPDAVTAVVGLLTAVDQRHPGGEAPDVDELRDRFVRAYYLEQARELVVELSREHETFHDTMVTRSVQTAVLTGGPGAGKSRLLRELAFRGALDIARPGPRAKPLRMPVLVSAVDLVTSAEPPDLPLPPGTLVLGAVHLLLDGLDEIPAEDRNRIAAWSRSLLSRYPRIRLTIAVRNRTWAADAFDLPVLELEPWNDAEIGWYLNGFPLTASERDEIKKGILELHRADSTAPPGLVTMVAETALTARVPMPLEKVYEKYFVDDLTEEAVAALASFAAASVGAHRPVVPTIDVHAFFDRGILEPDGEGARFIRLAERDFFAAQTLQVPGDHIRQRARVFAWRDPCLLAARLPSTPDEVVDLMVRSVRTADPRFAARLLAFRPAMSLDHVRTWTALLADATAGAHAHRVAAEALVLTMAPPAWQALADLLLARTTPVTTQVEVLGVLSEPHIFQHRTHRVFGPWLRQVLAAVLTGEYAADTQVAAMALISGRIRGLEVLLADLLRSAGHRVAVAADDVLRSFDVLVPRHLDEIRTTVLSARLAEVEAQLPALSGAGTIREANELRLRLLERLRDGPELLRRRYSYGIGSAVGDLLEGTEPESPENHEALVFAARADSPLDRLLIAAAAVSSPATVDHAAKVVADLAAVVEADRIEGLAALGQAVYQADRRRGFVATRRAARVLRDRGLAARWYWPWSTMLAHTSPAPAELDQFLAEGLDGALQELAGYAPSWDGSRTAAPLLGAAAREYVLADGHDDTEWVLAVAAARLTGTLSRVLEIAGNRYIATTVETISTGRYGIVEVAPHARVLAALGGLARESADPSSAHRLLDGFDTAGLPPSVAAGRLAGLAFLGDWEPLLRAAPGDGGPLDTASRQAIRVWAPGPCTPAGLRDPGDVAARLSRLRAEPGIGPERRSLLDELIYEAEQKHGELLAP
ncbi:hypothetical protein SAMN05421837_110249 [Amycolatopsis pretoriensis]|uniref:Ternary complex associated domain-containing protein n=1 Tax=Amycolatopsis pretoriensis TaxID=218821 RepID=A0A1H5REM6_9PSEU|nr:hypothetical protein [Amycolatopsis pretoriensis]SEF36494.1 hypothetical protein SAMN05421837_110249 [Amycolatopsis pretoriensis]